jgi:hypothetical protein
MKKPAQGGLGDGDGWLGLGGSFEAALLHHCLGAAHLACNLGGA